MSANADQDFVITIVKAIVNHPEDVSVDRRVDEMGVLLTLTINPADMGYVIGRQGQTARAIRTLLKIVGAKNNARVNLKIHDPNARQDSAGGSHYSNVDTSVVDDLKI
ncbi:MAG: KH domain-containing protein [Patescibacteria group bacterium]